MLGSLRSCRALLAAPFSPPACSHFHSFASIFHFLSWHHSSLPPSASDYFFGPTGAGNPNIIGFYVDDYWGPNGANEMDSHHLQDLGFTQADLDAQVAAFTWASSLVYSETLKRSKFIWDQFLNHDPYAPLNGDCPQPWVRQATCASDLRTLCNASSEVQHRALLYGFSPGSCTGTNPAALSDMVQDVANFLLVRGPYAYLGNGWLGCSREYEYPAQQFNADYGDPLGVCSETAAGSGIFVRDFTKSTVQMDCSTWTPTVTFK